MPAVHPDAVNRVRTVVTARLKHLFVLGALLLPTSAAIAKPAAIQCPGNSTYEMRDCASQSWEQSDAQLRQKVSQQLMAQWQETTRALCAAAYEAYKDGTIYPQLVVGCDDRLNRALVKEFKGMDEP